MRTIFTTYAGELIANSKDFQGRLLGVFHHGWYIQADSEVYMLHDSQYGYLPFGIGIQNFEQTLCYVKDYEGSQVCRLGQDIIFKNANIRLKLSYTEPPIDDSNFSEEVLQLLLECGLSSLETYGKGFLKQLALGEAQNGGEYPLHYLSYSKRVLHSFFDALSENDPASLATSLDKMLGFGIGLTPSMDDWLVGFMYVLNRTSTKAIDDQTKQFLTGYVKREALNKTSLISSAYLQASAKAMYFELLDKAIKNADALKRLCQTGGSSGTDMLTGMLFASAFSLNKSLFSL